MLTALSLGTLNSSHVLEYHQVREKSMGVVYIGDRFTGKTHLAMELANPRYESVMVTSPQNYYEELQRILINELGAIRSTDASLVTDFRKLEVKVKLNRWRTLQVDWVDTRSVEC